ncbi:zinc metallochaperone AztD [Pengzhenrongella sicca]|nr:zinc metallochaperone AztD [Pengzhenrongella sicca]
MKRPTLGQRYAVLGLALPLVLLGGCSSVNSDTSAATEPTPDRESGGEASEAAATTPRLLLTFDGGIEVLDATTLETISTLELDGFNRINSAGDGQHVLVSTAGAFQVLDAGTWAEPHGDHSHYYTADPALTNAAFGAEKPGHVVVHAGRTALFDDGTGNVVVYDSGTVADGDREVREYTTPSAHHGVAVELADGRLVVSEGTEEARTGIRVLDANNAEIARSDECPGVHGEAMAADETVVIGCEDGVLIYQEATITKVTSPDPYGRIGNQAGSEASPVNLGDYKTDPDAELERPTRVSLIDTRTAQLSLVDLPSSYSFRSLGRGAGGEALVLGTDGQLHVIDPEAKTLVRSIPVIEAWEEPLEWQAPRPALFVADGTAYITDPSAKTLYAVDIETGEIWNSVELAETPNEITGVSGAAAAVSDDEHGEGEHTD